MSRVTTMTGGSIRRGLGTVMLGACLVTMASCGGGGNGGGGDGSNNNPPPSGALADNQFAYVINSGAQTVQAYKMDGSGNLTASGGTHPTGVFPHDVDVDKNGKFVYISNHDSNFVSGYKVNAADGSLTAINPLAAGSPVTNLQGNDPTDNNPHASVMDQNAQFIYVVSGVDPALSILKTYTINGNTGTLTQIGTTGTLAQCLHGHRVVMSPNQLFVYVACEDSGQVYSFSRDTTSGQLTNLGATAVPGATAATIDPGTKFLFVSGTNGVSVFNINANGSIAPIQGQNTFAARNDPHSVIIDPSGNFLYAANLNSANISAYRVNQTTGALTELTGSPFATGGDPNYITVHPNGRELFTADAANTTGNDVSRFTINADGTLTRTANIATFPNGSGTNGIVTTKSPSNLF